MSHKNRVGDPSPMLRKCYKTQFARQALLTSCYIWGPIYAPATGSTRDGEGRACCYQVTSGKLHVFIANTLAIAMVIMPIKANIIPFSDSNLQNPHPEHSRNTSQFWRKFLPISHRTSQVRVIKAPKLIWKIPTIRTDVSRMFSSGSHWNSCRKWNWSNYFERSN